MIRHHRARLAVAVIAAAWTFYEIPAARAVAPNPLQSAYWRFEEGTEFSRVSPRNTDVVLDSINDNDLRAFQGGTIDAAPTYVSELPPTPLQSGLPNTLALDFIRNAPGDPDGAGDDLFANEQDINNGIIAPGGGFTVEAAFRPNSVSEFQAIVGKEGRPALGKLGGVFIENLQTFVLKVRGDTGVLQVELWDGGAVTSAADNPQVSSLSSLIAGQWYNAAVVNDGSTLSLYLDSNDGGGYQLQGSTPLSGGALYQGDDPNNPDWDRPWTIGRGEFGGGPADFFDGIIDEVRLTNVPLSPSQFLFAPPGGDLVGDHNQDGTVDAADYVFWRKLNIDGDAGYDDWREHFGETSAPGGGGQVPEPAAMALALVAAGMLVHVRISRP
jgi:hypothetical protein